MEGVNTSQVEGYVQKIIDLAIEYGPKLLMVVIVLLVGFWVIKLIVKGSNRAMERSGVEISLRKFLGSLLGIILKVLLIISAASMIGIATTSFVAIIGAAGLAIGLALQGGLANFAGGVMILIFKPFKVGDFIEAQGHMGVVHEISIFTTILKTPDNKTIIIPNGALSNGSVINYSTELKRRVDISLGIGYKADIEKAKQILNHLVEADSRIDKEPAPQIVVMELGENGVKFAIRLWCNSDDYWGIFSDMQEKVKQTFDKEGISFPVPQRIVQVLQ